MKGLHKDSIQDVGNPHQWMIEDARQSALQDVKAEIARRFRKYNEDSNHHLQAAECADIMSYLDSIQEKPICKEFEEDFRNYLNGRWNLVTADISRPVTLSNWFTTDHLREIAEHFFRLGVTVGVCTRFEGHPDPVGPLGESGDKHL